MNRLLCSVVVSAITLVVVASSALANEPSPQALAVELRQQLPAGWQFHTTEHHWVIRREKPVTLYNAINLPGFENREEFEKFVGGGSKWDYLIVVRFGPKVTAMQYEAWQAENRRADERQQELSRGLRGITQKFNQFAPGNAEEQRRVAQYKAAVAQLKRRHLPDFYVGDHSVYLETNQPWGLSFLDDKEALECGRVDKLVTAKFQKYGE